MKQAIPRCALAVCLGGASLLAYAADHAESPTVTADPAADIADVFIFRPDQSVPKLVVGLSFAGRPAVADGSRPRIDGPTIRCDRNVLYVFNIDNNADGNLDTTADIKVLARLGRNGNDQCGLQIEGLPGAAAVVSGATGTVQTDASGLRFFAGLVEDPFFFDSIGFGETLSTFAADGPSGELRFNTQRDAFNGDRSAPPPAPAGTVTKGPGHNLSAIVFEMDLSAVTGGDPVANPVIQVWADTFRFPGTQP